MDGTSGVRAALADSRARFDAAIAGLPPATLEATPAVGDWPVHDVAAHLIDWHGELLRAAEHARGGPPPAGQPITDEAYNDRSVARHAGEPWSALAAHLDGIFDRAVALADRCSSDELGTPAAFPWGGAGTIADLLRALVEHQEEHNAQIEAWRASGTSA